MKNKDGDEKGAHRAGKEDQEQEYDENYYDEQDYDDYYGKGNFRRKGK